MKIKKKKKRKPGIYVAQAFPDKAAMLKDWPAKRIKDGNGVAVYVKLPSGIIELRVSEGMLHICLGDNDQKMKLPTLVFNGVSYGRMKLGFLEDVCYGKEET